MSEQHVEIAGAGTASEGKAEKKKRDQALQDQNPECPSKRRLTLSKPQFALLLELLLPHPVASQTGLLSRGQASGLKAFLQPALKRSMRPLLQGAAPT